MDKYDEGHDTNLHDKDWSSPLCMIHTQSGCIPHLTRDTFSYINNELISKLTYHIPCCGLITYTDTFKEFIHSCAEFFSLPPFSTTYLALQDTACPTPKGFNTCNSVAVMACGQRIDLAPETYMEFVEALQPDMFELLVDSDVLPSDGKKRNTKSVDRSLHFIERCFQYSQGNSKLQSKSKMICGIVAGSKFLERLRFCELAFKMICKFNQNIYGYCIHSLPQDIVLSEATKNLIQMIKTELSGQKPLYVPGVSHPLTVVDYMIEGVSIFDTSSITSMTNKKQAFVYRYPQGKTKSQCLDGDTKLYMDEKFNFVEKIDLSDPLYARSFQPILVGCKCYTCLNHTCAYIHHLTVVKEMQCYVLLMIHNLHHHLKFFESAKQYFGCTSDLYAFRNELLKLNQK